MLNVVICDDSKENAATLASLLRENYSDVGNVKQFYSADSLKDYAFRSVKGAIDVLFLDIDLGGGENGISVAKEINAAFPAIAVVFVTGMVDYSQDIFQARPSYFLVKPVVKERLAAAMTKVLSDIEQEKTEFLSVETHGAITNIPYRDILYLESDKRKVTLYSKNGSIEFYAKLDDIAAKLPPYFIRCHKSYMVNIHIVKVMQIDSFLLQSGESLPISRAMYPEVKQKFLGYMGE